MIAHERPGVIATVEQHSDGPHPHLIISDDAYKQLKKELIAAIAVAELPDQLVGILWGGGPLARAVHLNTRIPVAYLAAESYTPETPNDKCRMARGKGIQFARDLAKTRPGFGTDILVVEDLTDSGRTLRDSIAWIRASPKYGPFIQRIRTACLWHKQGSETIPDIFIDEVVPVQPPGIDQPMLPWIDQPDEVDFGKPTTAEICREVERQHK